MEDSRLKELRNSIIETDREIVRLLNRRAGISLEIGPIKEELGMDVYDPARESNIYRNLLEASTGEMPAKSLIAVFREILSSSRFLQSPVTVAYFGPEASFTHLAAQSHFGMSSIFHPYPNIASVFADVEKGKVKWGVVPVENSLEGSVNLTLDKLIATPLHIRAEIFLRISHCLLSSQKCIEEIEKVYSHPQALAQCQSWLRMHLPRASLVEVESTAAAAIRAAKEGRGAAIGSGAAATVYGLDVLAQGIEDNVSNTTRFLVIGEGEGTRTGRDKTSLLMATPHSPGALYSALEPFAQRGINLMKIESYPVRDRLWEYMFFIDIAGHGEDEAILQTLEDLRGKTSFLKILGSYPRSEVAK